MKKFMALYMAPVAEMQDMMRNATPEQMKAGMADWDKWGKKNQKAIVDMGAPLGKTKKVANGGVSDIRNNLAGYSIVQGDSAEAVSQIFAGHPHLSSMKGAWIEIVECMPMRAA
jgi:hypothetical protein